MLNWYVIAQNDMRRYKIHITEEQPWARLKQRNDTQWQLRVDLGSFFRPSVSHRLIFAFVCPRDYFLLSFVSEFTSCPEQCRSLFQWRLSCSWYIVSLWVLFCRAESSAFHHGQTDVGLPITPRSPTLAAPGPGQAFMLIPGVQTGPSVSR